MDCHYCGAPADTKDHVVPVSYLRNGRPTNCRDIGETVDCCRECNCMLGAKALFSIPERAAEVAQCLERRYRKELNAPVWTDEEMKKLKGSLKKKVKAKQFLRDEVVERIRNATSVACGLLEQALPLFHEYVEKK